MLFPECFLFQLVLHAFHISMVQSAVLYGPFVIIRIIHSPLFTAYVCAKVNPLLAFVLLWEFGHLSSSVENCLQIEAF